MHALILAPSDNNPGFLEIYTSLTADEIGEDRFLNLAHRNRRLKC